MTIKQTLLLSALISGAAASNVLAMEENSTSKKNSTSQPKVLEWNDPIIKEYLSNINNQINISSQIQPRSA